MERKQKEAECHLIAAIAAWAMTSIAIVCAYGGELAPTTCHDDIPGSASLESIVDASGVVAAAKNELDGADAAIRDSVAVVSNRMESIASEHTNDIDDIIEELDGVSEIADSAKNAIVAHTNAVADYATVKAKAESALQVESDPTVAMTNSTIYIKGAKITPLTSHQSLARYETWSETKKWVNEQLGGKLNSEADPRGYDPIYNPDYNYDYGFGAEAWGPFVSTYNDIAFELIADTGNQKKVTISTLVPDGTSVMTATSATNLVASATNEISKAVTKAQSTADGAVKAAASAQSTADAAKSAAAKNAEAIADEATARESADSALTSVVAGKANANDVYKKTETYTQTEIDTKIAAATPSDYETVKSQVTANETAIATHTGDTTNPHKVTAAQVGALTSESDPTVSAWAKASTKPTYTASEVNAYTKAEADAKILAAPFVTSTAGVSTNSLTVTMPYEALDTNLTATLTPKGVDLNATYTEIGDVSAWSLTPYSILWSEVLTSTSTDYATVKENASSALTKATANATTLSGLHKVATSGKYTDLSNRPTIPTVVSQLTNDKNYITAADGSSLYYSKANGDAWATYWDGDDVRVTVTNYDSVAHLPSLYLEQRTNATSEATALFRTVWEESARWNKFLGETDIESSAWTGFDNLVANLETEIAAKADRAWGYYDSSTGAYSPEGYTQISSANLLLSSGMAYQKHLTTSGNAYFVLQMTKGVATLSGEESGTFAVLDSDGNTQVAIVSGDLMVMGADASGVTVAGNVMTVTYSVESTAHPTIYCVASLQDKPIPWVVETADDCPATVTWSGSSGAWVATVTAKDSSVASLFVKATYEAGQEDYVDVKVPTVLSGGIKIGDVTYTLGTATISGQTVLTLTPKN